MIQSFLLKLIELYQQTLSPDHGWFRRFYPGGYCKYEPSCSQYCRDVVGKYGAAKGLSKGAWRIMRCNPWSKGGYDPA